MERKIKWGQIFIFHPTAEVLVSGGEEYQDPAFIFHHADTWLKQ